MDYPGGSNSISLHIMIIIRFRDSCFHLQWSGTRSIHWFKAESKCAIASPSESNPNMDVGFLFVYYHRLILRSSSFKERTYQKTHNVTHHFYQTKERIKIWNGRGFIRWLLERFWRIGKIPVFIITFHRIIQIVATTRNIGSNLTGRCIKLTLLRE